MESVLDLSLKDAAMMAVNQKLILQRVGWDVYERVLLQYRDSNEVHFAYDDGFLEVEVPLFKHERHAEILRDLVTVICLEKKIDYVNAGSTTFRQKAKAKGCEPDTAFYIQNESRVRRLQELDLSHGPPPDLVIEVDITSPSLNKMPIYAALNVPEVWLYKGDQVNFFKLADGEYVVTSKSLAFPFLDSEAADKFLKSGLMRRMSEWAQDVRDWLNKGE